ncbi:MAG: integrase arm-type DNA-binding domain-containing protein [Hyphomonas sp.]
MAPSRLRALTDRQVQALQATTSVGGIPGLECVVSPTGTKSWRLLYRLTGDTSARRRSLGLGRYPTVGLAEARQRSAEALRLASEGTDPKHEREEKARKRDLTVSQAVEEYLAWCRMNNVAATAQDKQSVFKNHVLKRLGSSPLVSITRKDIAAILDKLGDRPARRRTAYSYLRHFFQWTAEREFIDANPCLVIRTPKTVPARERVLSDDEIRSLWTGTSVLSIMARLQLMTAQRIGSIGRMRWEDLDLQNNIWHIPAQDMKSGKSHGVPLSDPAVTLLSDWPRLTGPHLFGVGSDGSKAFNGRSKGMLRMRKSGAASDWRLHDLRRTAVTLAQRGGAGIDEIKALTQHKVAGVIGIYARHSYEKEKRAVVDLIGMQITTILVEERN